MDSAALAQKLSTYDANPVTSAGALNSALSQYGVPEIRQTVSGLRTTLANTQNAYNNVDPSVTGRTQGSLVTEAQREKQVNNERAPIAGQISDQSKSLGDNQTALQDALTQANSQADRQVNDYNTGRAALQSEYDTTYKSEQDKAAATLAAQQAAEATRQFNVIQANSRATSARSAASSPAQVKQAAIGHISSQLDANKGKDGKVSEQTWQGALSDALASGFSAQEFWQNYGQYVNRKYANTYAGYVSGYGGKYTS